MKRQNMNYTKYSKIQQDIENVMGIGRQIVHTINRVIDVNARSEFLHERCVFRPAPDGRYVVAELVRPLNAEVPQTTDTLHRNNVAGERTTVAQCVVSGDSGAEQRCCFGVT